MRQEDPVPWPLFVWGALLGVAVLWSGSFNRGRGPAPDQTSDPTQMMPAAPIPSATGGSDKDGIAVALLVDNSGNVLNAVQDTDGSSRQKTKSGKSCLLDVVKQVETYAAEQKDRPLLLSVHKFMGAGAAAVGPGSKPAPKTNRSAVEKMIRSGNKTLGEAVKAARQALDASDLSRRHILVVTYGKNTAGVVPTDVAKAIDQIHEDHRSAVHLLAFNVAGATFEQVKDAGWVVLSATTAGELKGTLDILIGEKIPLKKSVGPLHAPLPSDSTHGCRAQSLSVFARLPRRPERL